MSYLKMFKTQFLSIFKNRGLMILLFIGPIFLTLLFGGVYFNDYVNDISIAILDEDNSTISNTITDYFAANERFQVEYYVNTGNQLEELINSGDVQMGLWIPDGFESDVLTSQSPEVLAITDGTNIVISNNAYAQAATIVQTIAAGVEMKLIQGNGLTPQISEDIALIINAGERILYDSKMTYMNYLIVSFLAVFLQALTLSAMGSMFIRNKDYLSKGRVFLNAFGANSACVVGILPSAAFSLYVLNHLFNVPINGNLWVALLMTVVFLGSLTGPALIIAALSKHRITYSQFSYMLSVPTILTSGCLWPVEQMPEVLVTLIRCIWPLINYAKIVQEVIIKGRELHTVLPNIYQMLIYGIVWGIIGAIAYKMSFRNEDTTNGTDVVLAN